MKNEQFEKDIEVVPGICNGLSIVEIAGEKLLKGELPIVDATGKEWAKYQIEIRGSGSYPLCFPKLFETDDAFPHNADWHVYEIDESCCVDIPNNEIIICKNGLNVADYIKRFVIPYFANQTFRIREGYYLYGEYSHGIFGKIEYYQTKLRANSPQQFIQMFDFIIRGVHLERTALCPFCHKSKFRKCHRNVFTELSQIKWLMAMDGMEQLIPFFAAHPDYQLPKV